MAFSTVTGSVLYDINITRVNCVADEYYCQNSVCSGMYRPPDLPIFNISCTFPITYTKLKLKFTSYYKYTVFRQALLNQQEDICEYFDNRGFNPMLKIFGDSVLKYSDFQGKKCPFENGTYSLINYEVSLEVLPPSFPDGQYRFDVQLGNQVKRQILLVQIFATLKNKILF
ncbi:uncharacterized protein LOC129805196 [Phlebotomus papatasi]|uniref:uncharacterized protein LOC129805196 n=1 Tax=Phlebotomus papatasi TaxID=29031 RepID=UPI00248394DF|nr:uncharacterized protein LOC129805196 [Phlebotomus papatasi]